VRTAVVETRRDKQSIKTFRTTPRGRDKIDEAVVFELKWTEDMKDTEKASDRREESSHDGAVRGGRVAS
jgi:hypothetical protein